MVGKLQMLKLNTQKAGQTVCDKQQRDEQEIEQQQRDKQQIEIHKQQRGRKRFMQQATPTSKQTQNTSTHRELHISSSNDTIQLELELQISIQLNFKIAENDITRRQWRKAKGKRTASMRMTKQNTLWRPVIGWAARRTFAGLLHFCG